MDDLHDFSCTDEPNFAIAPMTRPIGSTRPSASAEGGGQHLSGCSAGPQRNCRVWFIWEAGQKHQKPMDGRDDRDGRFSLVSSCLVLDSYLFDVRIFIIAGAVAI